MSQLNHNTTASKRATQKNEQTKIELLTAKIFLTIIFI